MIETKFTIGKIFLESAGKPIKYGQNTDQMTAIVFQERANKESELIETM